MGFNITHAIFKRLSGSVPRPGENPGSLWPSNLGEMAFSIRLDPVNRRIAGECNEHDKMTDMNYPADVIKFGPNPIIAL